eukprot:scaffold1228_cov115-Isochrysis_galbana.AAC.9
MRQQGVRGLAQEVPRVRCEDHLLCGCQGAAHTPMRAATRRHPLSSRPARPRPPHAAAHSPLGQPVHAPLSTPSHLTARALHARMRRCVQVRGRAHTHRPFRPRFLVVQPPRAASAHSRLITLAHAHGVPDTHTPSSICAAPFQAAPARDGFMMKLASTEEEVFTRIGAMMPVVNEILSINDGYLRAKGIETA